MRGQAKLAHGVFSETDTEDTVRLMSNGMACRAHKHILCSDLVVHHRSRSFCAPKEKAGDVKGDPKGEKETASEVFELKDQAYLCNERCGVYNWDIRRGRLLRASVLEVMIHFWRKRATWDTMLQPVDYKAIENVVRPHPGCKTAMTNIPRVPQEEALY